MQGLGLQSVGAAAGSGFQPSSSPKLPQLKGPSRNNVNPQADCPTWGLHQCNQCPSYTSEKKSYIRFSSGPNEISLSRAIYSSCRAMKTWPDCKLQHLACPYSHVIAASGLFVSRPCSSSVLRHLGSFALGKCVPCRLLRREANSKSNSNIKLED